jgi:fatty acid-binding protein DegV
MNQAAIVTDSAANLPGEPVKQHTIHVLPLKIIWRGQVLR